MMLFMIWILLQSPMDPLFSEAANHLTQKRFVEAATVLNTIDASGAENGPMLINLGIAYAQLDSLGLAKLHFTRAAAYPEVKEQAETGLTYVTQQLQRRASGLPTLSFNRHLNTRLAGFRPALSLWISIVLLNAGALVLVWYFRTGSHWRKRSAAALFAFSALGFIHHGIFSSLTTRYDLGVVVRQEVALREEPSSGSASPLPVFEGYDVRIDRSQAAEGWVRVILINGTQGWLPANAVRPYPSKARP